MTLLHRHRINWPTLLIGIAAAVILCILLDFYIDERSSMIDDRNSKSQTVTDDTSVLQRADDLKKLTAQMRKAVETDASSAEGQLLHIVHDWEQRAGAGEGSFQRVGLRREQGFTQLTFDITADGDMSAVAGLIYQIETASVPLRVENIQIGSKSDGDDLQLHLEISTLYRNDAGPIAQLARGPG
jgi:type II secretion system (T2SS) protein M